MSAWSADELAGLGRALNVMTVRLRDKFEDLEAERAKTTAILDGMIEGVVAVDRHDHLLLVNERARIIFQLARRPVEGKALLEVIRNSDLYAVLAARRTAAMDEPLHREIRLPGPPARSVQVNAVPLQLGENGIGVLMVLHDVTELRRLELVRREFLANVSHELRSPLTAIQGYLETLVSDSEADPALTRKFLEIVFRHTERLGRLVSDLTDLSNIELGKITLRLAPTPPEDVSIRSWTSSGRLR